MIREKIFLLVGYFAKIAMHLNPNIFFIYNYGKNIKRLHTIPKINFFKKPKNREKIFSNKNNINTFIDLLLEQYKKCFCPIGRLDFLRKGAVFIIGNEEILYILSNPKFKHKKYILKILWRFKKKLS